jgi:hypothetical protein
MYPDTGPLNAVVTLIQTRKPESAKNVIGLDSQQGNYYSSRQKAMLTLAIMLKRTGASALATQEKVNWQWRRYGHQS